MGCSRGDDCRFVPPDPPRSALALLSEAEGECDWRWVAPGVSSRRKPDRGAQISVAIEWMRFEGGGIRSASLRTSSSPLDCYPSPTAKTS